MPRSILLIFLLILSHLGNAQTFTKADTLRGSVGPARAWWDVKAYDLHVNVDIDNKMLRGSNDITFRVLEPGSVLQIDLQAPMKMDRVKMGKTELDWTQDGAAYFIQLPKTLETGKKACLTIDYSGHPREAQNAPWDGGLSWKTDQKGRPFVATSCQGAGASLWWPCKDHPADEAEEMKMTFTVPKDLVAVGNGKLIGQKHTDQYSSYTWQVKNPINHYGVNMNIAHYHHWDEQYAGLSGKLPLNYYVLDYEEDKARKQFGEVKRMLEAFEYWFGPYPFYSDGYKLVEVPYLGMEHQSSVTYGNQYANGYLGRDLSQTGWGLLFDFIIIHESAHEWWANSVTAEDNADMWIHEAFTHYSESLFLEYHFGKDTAFEYIQGVRSKILNDRPIQGKRGVNHPGSVDMYYKGANIIHMLRMWINDDSKWRQLLQGIQETFRHQTIRAEELFQYIEKETGLELEPFVKQWIQSAELPIFQYRVFPGGIQYKWSQCTDDFNMPIDLHIDEKSIRLQPTTDWQIYRQEDIGDVNIDLNYYVGSMRLN